MAVPVRFGGPGGGGSGPIKARVEFDRSCAARGIPCWAHADLGDDEHPAACIALLLFTPVAFVCVFVGTDSGDGDDETAALMPAISMQTNGMDISAPPPGRVAWFD